MEQGGELYNFVQKSHQNIAEADKGGCKQTSKQGLQHYLRVSEEMSLK